MKRMISAGAAALLLMGCGTALKERAPTHDSVLQRMLQFQESLMAIAATSSTPAEAAARVEKYCRRHADAFQKLRADAQGLDNDPVLTMRFATDLVEGVMELAKKGEDDLKDKMDILGSEELMAAAQNCNVPQIGAEGEAPAPPVVDEGEAPAGGEAESLD